MAYTKTGGTCRADPTSQKPRAIVGLDRLKWRNADGRLFLYHRQLVTDGRMPRPRRIDGRIVFDVDEVRAAFKALPHEAEAESGTWADLK